LYPQSTKYFAKEAEEKSSRINPNDDKTKDIQNNNFYGMLIVDIVQI
jgi:hypothetical protein